MRNWLKRSTWQLVRVANRPTCDSLIRFSASLIGGHRCGGLAAVPGIPAGPDRCARRNRCPHGCCDCAPVLGRANPSRGVGQSPLLVHHLALGSHRCVAVRDRDGAEACHCCLIQRAVGRTDTVVSDLTLAEVEAPGAGPTFYAADVSCFSPRMGAQVSQTGARVAFSQSKATG